MLSETRLWARYMSGAAEAVDVDSQGRILIPQKLREYAGLNGNVVVVGLVSRIEVWNPDKARAISEQVESDALAVSQKMGELMVGIANSSK
jgi:MraZ protein